MVSLFVSGNQARCVMYSLNARRARSFSEIFSRLAITLAAMCSSWPTRTLNEPLQGVSGGAQLGAIIEVAAVLCGIIIAALNFAWQHARELYADSDLQADGSKLYRVHGTLFFASCTTFLNQFEPAADPQQVTLDCRHLSFVDYSAIAARGAGYGQSRVGRVQAALRLRKSSRLIPKDSRRD